jgi:adenylate cyclase
VNGLPERPNLNNDADSSYHAWNMTETRALSILFADVSGSTRLFEQRGDVEARRIIAAVLDAMSQIVLQHGGRVIKTIGDEIMCVFPGAVNGVHAACDMQRRVTSDPDFVRDNIGLRIGMHYGETLIEDNDVYGDAVNTAARMTTLAKREQIVTTAATFRDVTSLGGIKCRALGRARVAGKLMPIEIVDVIWQQDTSNVTMVQRAIRSDDGVDPSQNLTLRFRGQVIELGPNSPTFSMGRDAANSLVIDAEWVSRSHASISFKNGHFVLADKSTNATYVRFGEDDDLRLHRDEVLLRQSGIVSLGQIIAPGHPDLLYFQCGK